MGKLKKLILTQVLKLTQKEKTDPRRWVFSSTDNSHYNYNSRYLFEYVKDNMPDIEPLFVINDPVLRDNLSEQYGKQYFTETCSPEGIRKVLGAGVWFTSAGLPVYGFHMKKDRMIVNLWHGIPLKKIALMDPNLSKAAGIYFRKIFSDNYTCILTCSKALIPVMAESFGVTEDKIKVWGQPRNDVLFSDNDRDSILKNIYGTVPEYRKLVLYAPTFRDYGETRLFPFKDYNREKLEAYLEKEKIILCVRTHIKEQANAGRYLSGHVLYLGNEQAEDVMDILNIFDLLITDYSSIYIDYLILDRPELFLPYDKERYLKGRGFNYDYDQITPGPKPQTMEEFMNVLSDIFHGKDEYAEQRRACSTLFNQINKPCMEHICNEVRKYVHID